MKELTVQQLKQMQDAGEVFQLIDVREPWEVEICRISTDHIPMGEILNRSEEIKKDVPVVVHCRSGARSSNVVKALELHLELKNLHNLKGGILAWANEIDHSLEQY